MESYSEPVGGPKARRPAWVLWTICAVVGLMAVVLIGPMTKGGPAEEARPGVEAGAVGTSGTVPGASSGPTGEDDFAYVPMRDVHQNGIVAYFDRQPLYVVDAQPIQVDDRLMIVEGVANQERPATNYMVYVPAATAGGSAPSARHYYLKVGPNQYVKVSLQGNTD